MTGNSTGNVAIAFSHALCQNDLGQNLGRRPFGKRCQDNQSKHVCVASSFYDYELPNNHFARPCSDSDITESCCRTTHYHISIACVTTVRESPETCAADN